MQITCFSDLGGLLIETPLDRDPPDKRPPGQRPPGQRPSWKEHGTRDRDPPRGNMRPSSQTGSDIIQRHPVDRMTDTCKNITLPQTLFVGGNYIKSG